MVSYVRARAESLGFSAKVGILTRAERYIVLLPGIIFHYPEISLWILAIMTHFTALQRFFYVRKQVEEGLAPRGTKERRLAWFKDSKLAH